MTARVQDLTKGSGVVRLEGYGRLHCTTVWVIDTPTEGKGVGEVPRTQYRVYLLNGNLD